MTRIFLTLFLLLWAPLVAAQGNYQVQIGDVLQVEVLEDPTLNRNALVLPDGRISYPFAGTVRAGGRTLNQISRAITSAIATNFATEPTVFVSVARLNTPEQERAVIDPGEDLIEIYFLGEVGSPGPVEVPEGTTMLQGLSRYGGFTDFAATKRIQLRRSKKDGSQELVTINYHALSRGAALTRDFELHDGDVILVPERRLFE